MTAEVGRGFSLDLEKLTRASNEYAPRYAAATPFPHCVIDGLFPESALNEVLREYPGAGDLDWIRKNAETSKLKLATRDETQLGPKTRAFIHELNSATFITALERITGIDGLIYGEDPSEGFVRGRRFLHPRLGFTFAAPDGFSLDNTAQAVLGVRDGGGQALRLDVVRVPAEQTLSEYLTSGWIENIDHKSVEELGINGLRAATATAKGDQWAFRLYAVRFGTDVYRFIFASKRMTAEVDRAFRESVASFRRMTLAESQTAKPLHIRIMTVAPGDTIERLASRMAVTDRALERFRVLNGLAPGDRIKPGDQVKMVVE